MITRLGSHGLARVIGHAVGGVAVAGSAVTVTASPSEMSLGLRPAGSQQAVQASTPSTACSSFMKHFAVEIGKSQAEINSAFQKAIADTLADEVKAGHLTQAQADTIKKKLANQTPCSLPSLAPRSGKKAPMAAYMAQYLNAAASALGIT